MHLFGGAENIIKASLNNQQLSNTLVDLQHNDFLENNWRNHLFAKGRFPLRYVKNVSWLRWINLPEGYKIHGTHLYTTFVDVSLETGTINLWFLSRIWISQTTAGLFSSFHFCFYLVNSKDITTWMETNDKPSFRIYKILIIYW